MAIFGGTNAKISSTSIVESRFNIFGSVSSVGSGVEKDIVSYTVPLGKTFVLSAGSGHANTDCFFKLIVDGNIQEVEKNAWTDRNVKFIARITISAGSIVKITGIHNNHLLHTFYANITGMLI